MTFRILGLDPAPFRPLYGLPDAALAEHGARRYAVDASPGFPDRVELVDVPVGGSVLLVNHVSQPAGTPYRASHAIFVREGAAERFDRIGVVPEVMRRRTLSLRGFDAEGMMVDADLVEGPQVESLIERLFALPDVATIHVHYARRGCYSALVARL